MWIEATAVILCGGLGTRLRSVVDDRPKFLAEVDGRPFAHYVLRKIASLGVKRVVLCTGYLGDQIEAALGPSLFGLELVYSREREPLGTAGAVRSAMGFINTELVLLINGDSYCDADLTLLMNFHRERSSSATLLLVRAPDPRGFGRVVLEGESRIARFDEKSEEPGPAWVNAGVYLFAASRLATLPETRPLSLEREILPGWIASGVYGYASTGRLLDIGTPATYEAAAAYLASLPR
jgi:D-glycero-alpha-D-manno-heptose 1-phosphate guanylyltransferase